MIFTRLVMVSLAVLMVLAALGCSPEPLELTLEDSGSSQVLAPDQEMVITLDSNPTTGYKWEREGAIPEPLAGGDSEYTADSSALGAGGTEVWRFKGTSAGEGTLTLKYWRSFEPTVPPLKTFTVDVKVGR